MMKMTHPPSKQNSAASKAITTLVVCILLVVVPEYEQSTSVVSLSVVSRETARLGHSDRFFFRELFFFFSVPIRNFFRGNPARDSSSDRPNSINIDQLLIES